MNGKYIYNFSTVEVLPLLYIFLFIIFVVFVASRYQMESLVKRHDLPNGVLI